MSRLAASALVTGSAPAPSRPRRRWSALWLAVPALGGCYTTRPIEPVTAPGTTVVLDINDRGRVELGDRIGPGALSVEGALTTRTDSSYSVHVASVRYLNGNNQWAGEPFTVPARLVGQAWQRDFSRTRTFGLGAGVAAGLLLLLKSTNLIGGGSSPTGNNPPGPPGGS